VCIGFPIADPQRSKAIQCYVFSRHAVSRRGPNGAHTLCVPRLLTRTVEVRAPVGFLICPLPKLCSSAQVTLSDRHYRNWLKNIAASKAVRRGSCSSPSFGVSVWSVLVRCGVWTTRLLHYQARPLEVMGAPSLLPPFPRPESTGMTGKGMLSQSQADESLADLKGVSLRGVALVGQWLLAGSG
jgi:hypothetical protein